MSFCFFLFFLAFCCPQPLLTRVLVAPCSIIYETLLLIPLLLYHTAPTEVPGNVSVIVNSSSSIILSWERPSQEQENGLLICYHVIIMETQIHYTDDRAEITGMQTYLNMTFNVSEGRSQLIDMLHPDYNYTVRIAAATGPGIGPFSDAITVRTYMDGEYDFSKLIFHDQ